MAQAADGSNLPGILHAIARRRELLVPLGFLALIGVLVVPLPALMLDLLICANLSLAAIVLLTTIQMKRPLEFSVFPALLLATTLFRLVLNVASTRLILSADGASPEELKGVAGNVIDAFANFVAGNDAVVGGIIFIILIVVQFVVITKGATRMSEVAARFTLDAMPGKQMAIDADLSAGLISETDARERREEVTREADFYGAMDGASKFVRGDAIAGIVITLVNIIGGVAIGVMDNGLDVGSALRTFGMLSIGDGLVSQIPAFIVAIAAGLIVARAGGGKAIGDAIPSQLVSQPTALFMIALFLGMLAFTGLPAFPLVSAALTLAALGLFSLRGRKLKAERARAEAAHAASAVAEEAPPVDDLLRVDTLEIELGYGLVQLVDSGRGGGILEQITRQREDMAGELGIVLPPVRIRDNVQLPSEQYRLRIRGAVVGEGVVHPSMIMAMDPGVVTNEIEGVREVEPVFGLEAVWIDPAQRTRAENANYVVIEPGVVLVTHLVEIARRHADELLSREEVSNLIEKLKEKAPKLVEETVPAQIKPGELQKVLQSLLRERVPIRDLETILETLSEWSQHTKDPDVLVEYVRNGLRRTICAQYAMADERGVSRIRCVTVDPTLEEQISGYKEQTATGTTLLIPPQLASSIGQAAVETLRPLVDRGERAIVVASPGVRAQVREVVKAFLPDVVVLGINEIIDVEMESLGLIQLAPTGNISGEASPAPAAVS